MSAMPRPWEPGIAGNANVVHFDGDDVKGVAKVFDPETSAYMIRAVNAFDALLAVARVADTVGPGNDTPPEWFQLHEALTALDAAHPDWREWK